MRTAVAILIDTVREKQGLGSDSAFCEQLGISRATWWLIRKGKQKPGQKFIKGVMREYPDLTLVIMNYMAEKESSDA